jgi:high-affinity iron transporter
MEIEHGLTAFVILLREGLEVLFIVLSVYAITKRAVPILFGCFAGVLINVVLGVVFGKLGLHSEFAEHSLMLGAAALMLYVARGLLLWQFTGAKKKLKLKERAHAIANNYHPIALFTLSAFLVGREAFELMIFLQALSLRAGGWSISILSGIAFALASIVMVYFLFNRLANRLPIRFIFVVSSVWLLIQAGLIVWDVFG